ncbi:hypothetical protein MHK_000837 [Candidatus Magnetomorum sp. HK-1]|nr:hypothetical protein MHK_000837 [Candidatus Magnetomorum sp. HK-1]
MKTHLFIKDVIGFSMIEILFALVLFSFGLTALMRTHQIAASTLNSVRNQYSALLIAQESLESAIALKNISLNDYEILQNNILYNVNYDTQYVVNDTYELKVNVQWKNKKISISKRIIPMMKQ